LISAPLLLSYLHLCQSSSTGGVDHPTEAWNFVLQEPLHSSLECHLRSRSPMTRAFQADASIRPFDGDEFNVAAVRLERRPDLGQRSLDLSLKLDGHLCPSSLHWIHEDASSPSLFPS
jgi:hypothetical protein